MVGFYGWSTFVFSFVSTELVNPSDKRPTVYDRENDVTYFEPSVANRVPNMLQTLTLIWFILVVASLFLINRKEVRVSEIETDESRDLGSVDKIKSVKHCIYSIRFWQYFLMMVFSNYFGTFFMYTYKTYGENKSRDHPPISDEMLTWAASIGAGLVNGFSRVVLGLQFDTHGFKKLFTILMVS